MNRMSPLEHSQMLINNTVPLFSYKKGDDICSFQKNGKATLKNLLGINEINDNRRSSDILIEYDIYAEDLGCREIQFLVESENNVIVPCHLLLPKANKKSPLIIALHGHSTGMHVCLGRRKYPCDDSTIREQECDFAKQAVNRGYAVLVLEHRGFGARGGDEHGAKCSELAFRAMMVGRTLLGERVFDVKSALDAVINNFGDLILPDNIICLGYSGGGTIGTYLSAIDDRIKITVISSAISTFSKSIGAMPHCPCNYVPSISKYFDVGNICQLIAPRTLVVISGDEDPIFPIDGTRECVNVAKVAFEEYGAENNLVHIAARGAHKFYPNEVWNALSELL